MCPLQSDNKKVFSGWKNLFMKYPSDMIITVLKAAVKCQSDDNEIIIVG